MTAPTRLALVGLGKQGRAHHLPTIASLADQGVSLVGIAEVDTEDARAMLKAIRPADQVGAWQQRGYITTPEAAEAIRNAPVFPTLPMLLETAQVDAVIIATPPSTHAGLAVEAIQAGLPVLVEKPVAPTETEARSIADAAPPGHVVAVASSFPHSLDASALLNVYGPPDGMEIIWRRHDGIPSAPHFWDAKTGGVAPDLFPHMLRVADHLVRTTPVRVRYQGSGEQGRTTHGNEFIGHDTATALITTAEDIVIKLHASWADMAPGDEDFIVRWSWHDGRRAEIPIIAQKSDDHRPEPVAYRAVFRNERDGGGFFPGPVPRTYAQAMVAQLRDFLHAGETGTRPVVSLEDAARDTKLIGRMMRARGAAWTEVPSLMD